MKLTRAVAQAMQDDAKTRGAWLMWFVTEADAQHLGKVVARAYEASHHGGQCQPGALVADTLDELRAMLPTGLTRRNAIVGAPVGELETWD